MQKCYDSSLSKTTAFEWHMRFGGRESVKDDTHPGCTWTSKTDENVYVIKSMLMKNRRLTVREMADETWISLGSIQRIFYTKITYCLIWPWLFVDFWPETQQVLLINHQTHRISHHATISLFSHLNLQPLQGVRFDSINIIIIMGIKD